MPLRRSDRQHPHVAVVTDSTAALPPGAAERWGVHVVPLQVLVDGAPPEAADLTTATLDAVQRGVRVTTSQPAPAAFADAYAAAAAAGASAVVSVHLSGELSGTVAAARSAAERAPLPVHVVDSRTAAMGLGFAALAAAWAAAGTPPADALVIPRFGPTEPTASSRRRFPQLRRHAEAVPAPDADAVAAAARAAAESSRVWFLVDSLEHLRRGGRLSAPVAALGTVLGLRPLLTVSDGRLVVAEKIRTRRAAVDRLVAVATAAALARPAARLAIHHAGRPEAAQDLARRLAEATDGAVREVVVSPAGAVLTAHVGPGLLAVVVSDDAVPAVAAGSAAGAADRERADRPAGGSRRSAAPSRPQPAR